MKRILVFCITALSLLWSNEVVAVEVSLSKEEKKLYDMIMLYRAEKGLPSIPLSASLTYVAQTHVRDLQDHPRFEGCNLHSWSEYGKWSAVCYTDDPTEEAKKAVWNKPRELTQYTGAGYEISFWNSAGATATSAINGWKKSSGHNATMINLGIWKGLQWRAIGIGIYGEYAVVWFGEEEEEAPIEVSAEESKLSKENEELAERIRQMEQQMEQQRQQMEQMRSREAQQVRQQSEYAAQQARQQSEYAAEQAQREARLAQQAQQKDQEQRLNALKEERARLQAELKKIQDEKAKQQKQAERNAKREARKNDIHWPSRFYDYSGYSSLSYLSFGYKYSCMSGAHLVNMSLLDFRAALFRASLLNVEMSVSPFNKRFAYMPQIGICIPVGKCFSLSPYGGAEIDASYIGKYMDKNYSYDVDNDFYINAIGGIAFQLTAAKHVPMEIKVEYRHPVLVRSAGALNPKGVYVGAQIYFGSVFDKRR